eukprot:2158856-Prymnesium_polylepis.1
MSRVLGRVLDIAERQAEEREQMEDVRQTLRSLEAKLSAREHGIQTPSKSGREFTDRNGASAATLTVRASPSDAASAPRRYRSSAPPPQDSQRGNVPLTAHKPSLVLETPSDVAAANLRGDCIPAPEAPYSESAAPAPTENASEADLQAQTVHNKCGMSSVSSVPPAAVAATMSMCASVTNAPAASEPRYAKPRLPGRPTPHLPAPPMTPREHS